MDDKNAVDHRLGEKSIACLRVAATKESEAWRRAYEAVCARWGEKVVLSTFERLSRRGYIEYGVSERTGWLTDKGRVALGAA